MHGEGACHRRTPKTKRSRGSVLTVFRPRNELCKTNLTLCSVEIIVAFISRSCEEANNDLGPDEVGDGVVSLE